MPPELDPEIAATMTDEELAAIADDDQPSAADLAALQRIADAASGDDGDDDDGDDGNAGETGAATNAPATAKPTGEAPAPAAEATSTTDETAQPAERQAAAPAYEAKLPDDYQDQVKALADQETELKAKFNGGEIDFDEFEAQRGELLAKRDDLNMVRAKAEISQEMTQQSAKNLWKTTVDTFVDKAAAEKGGIDYRKDAAKQADLDQFVKVLANRDENADKPMDWFLTEAHKRVKALHGVNTPETKPDPAAAIKAANAARKPSIDNAPVTLAQVPGGDGPGDVAGEFADIDALEGEALEAAIAKLSPAQRDKWARGR